MGVERSLIRHVGLGAVLIGYEPVASAGVVAINLPGAILNFDPARPDLMLSCLAGDVELAAPGVEQIFGGASAKGLLDVASEQRCKSGAYQVREGEALGLLRGLVEIRWCRDSSDLLLDSLLLGLEELTLLRRLADRIGVDREWREPLLTLLGCLTQSPKTLSRLQGHPTSRNLLLDATDVLAGTAIPDSEPVRWPEALQYALAAGGIEPEEEEGEEVEPCPPPGPGGMPTASDARHLTAQRVFDLRLYVIAGDQGLPETGRLVLETATRTWRVSGARMEAAAVRELLDPVRNPDFPANWPVRPSVTEQVYARTGTESGRRLSAR